MNGDVKEELLTELESARNFMLGITFDQRIHIEVREALRAKAAEIDEIVNKHLD